MKAKTLLAVAVVIGLLGAGAACRSQGREWKGTITEKDGVVIVHNPKEPLYPEARLDFKPESRIGRAEGPSEYLFSQIRDFAVDAEGRVYVIDVKENEIRIFDPNGAYLRTVGRAGQGPAEFTEPGNVHINAAGEIMATDGGSQSLKIFAPDGAFLRRQVLKSIYPMKAAYGSGPIAYFMTFSQNPPGFQLLRYDSRTEDSVSLAVWKMPPPDPGRASVFDPYMSFSVLPDDRLVYGCPVEGYEIGIFDARGRLERKILREFDPGPILDREKQAILDELKKRPGGPQTIAFPKNHPPYLAVNNDDDGRIIVQVFSELMADPSRTSESVFDVFDTKGRYLAQIRHPFKGLFEKPIVWKKGKMYTVEQDEEGFPSIVRFGVEGLSALGKSR